MAYIRVVDEDEAEGELFTLYDEVQRTRGRVSNVLSVQSLHPRAMKRHLDLYMELLYGKGALSRLQRELIAVVVSAANGCDYCVAHHSDALLKYAKDPALVKQVAADHTKLDLPPADRALSDYAHGLTVAPATGRREAVEALRSAGFNDEAILLATEIVAYFNFVNRLVHGLGVDLEKGEARSDYNY